LILRTCFDCTVQSFFMWNNIPVREDLKEIVKTVLGFTNVTAVQNVLCMQAVDIDLRTYTKGRRYFLFDILHQIITMPKLHCCTFVIFPMLACCLSNLKWIVIDVVLPYYAVKKLG
ncbi:hypothetical protein T4A_6709, partial [Trichinella pseudospiralis]